MHFGNFRFFVAASLAVVGSAAPPQPIYSASSPPKPSGSSQCFTRNGWGNGLSNTQTTWSTRYTSCTSILTSTVTQTTTSPPVTTTLTSTTTTTITAPTSSFTATDTSTSTVTTITTSTEIDTATSTTTTTTTATSTVPTASGFVPIQSSLPGATYNGPAGPIKRAFGGFNVASNSAKLGLSPAQSLNQPRYPKGFNCITYAPAKCSTLVSTTTVTSTATGRSTITTITTSTATTTTVPSATTTVTTTTTSTSTSTASTTTTTTATITSSVTTTTTVYAACATNNLANLYNNQGISRGEGSFTMDDVTSTNSAYDCCVAALTYSSGASAQGWAWVQDGSNTCEVVYTPGTTAPTCAQADDPFTLYTGSAVIVIGNAPCGEWTSAG